MLTSTRFLSAMLTACRFLLMNACCAARQTQFTPLLTGQSLYETDWMLAYSDGYMTEAVLSLFGLRTTSHDMEWS